MEPMQYGLEIKISHPEAITETYLRSWHERLFSYPWRPWVKYGERPTTWTLIKGRMADAQKAMSAALDQQMYSTLEGKDGRS